MEGSSRLERMSAEILAPVVGKLLNVPDLAVTSWKAHLVKGGWEFPYRTIARFSGGARIPDVNRERSWSLYFKAARKASRGATSNIADHYQREALFYGSGLFDDLPGAASWRIPRRTSTAARHVGRPQRVAFMAAERGPCEMCCGA